MWESDIEDKVRKLFDERSDPSAQAIPIVIYCSGGDCEDSHMLAQKLWGIQFNNIYVYKDGFPDWQQHGAPIHERGLKLRHVIPTSLTLRVPCQAHPARSAHPDGLRAIWKSRDSNLNRSLWRGTDYNIQG